MDYGDHFEKEITEGRVQRVKISNFQMNRISMEFDNDITGKKELSFTKVISFHMDSDFEPYDLSSDFLDYKTLIGFHYRKENNIHITVVKVDEYEIVIKSKELFTLTRVGQCRESL